MRIASFFGHCSPSDGVGGWATGMKISFAPAILAIVLFTGCDTFEYPSPKLESLVESSAPVYRTTSEALASTGGPYLGKVIEVTGVVRSVSNKGGRPGVTLSGPVICGFGKRQKSMVAALREGDRITLRGIYKWDMSGTGPESGPYLTPCIRVP